MLTGDKGSTTVGLNNDVGGSDSQLYSSSITGGERIPTEQRRPGTSLSDMPLEKQLRGLNNFPRIGKFRGNGFGVQHGCSRHGRALYTSHQEQAKKDHQ